MYCRARGRGTHWSLLHAPWDTSLNMSTAASAQECAEGDFVAEQTWREGKTFPSTRFHKPQNFYNRKQ